MSVKSLAETLNFTDIGISIDNHVAVVERSKKAQIIFSTPR